MLEKLSSTLEKATLSTYLNTVLHSNLKVFIVSYCLEECIYVLNHTKL